MPQTRRDTPTHTHTPYIHSQLVPFIKCLRPALIEHRPMWQAGQINANCRMLQLPATVAETPQSLYPSFPPPLLLFALHCTKLNYSTNFCQYSNLTNLLGNKLVSRRSRSRRREYTCKTCSMQLQNFNLNCELLAGAARADSLPEIPCIPQWTILFFYLLGKPAPAASITANGISIGYAIYALFASNLQNLKDLLLLCLSWALYEQPSKIPKTKPHCV